VNHFAIFGNPVSHSKSPLMHNLTFRGLNYDGCYSRYLLEDGKRLKEKFLELKLKGINITVPHKEEAYLACDHLDPFAERVGAVNTIINRDGELYGYNTDALGFLKAIEEFRDIKEVLFLGAGGTARSTSSILRDEGYSVTILNRSSGRLESFSIIGLQVEIEGCYILRKFTCLGIEYCECGFVYTFNYLRFDYTICEYWIIMFDCYKTSWPVIYIPNFIFKFVVGEQINIPTFKTINR